MIIHFTNQRNKPDFVEVNRPELIVPYNKQGLHGIHWGIHAKKRANDAHPIVLGFFVSEEKRDAVIAEIKTAIGNKNEFTVEGALPVDRDFSKMGK